MSGFNLAPSQFKLANLFPNSVSLTILHNTLLRHPARQKIKTCHEICNNLITDIFQELFQIEITTKSVVNRTLSMTEASNHTPTSLHSTLPPKFSSPRTFGKIYCI